MAMTDHTAARVAENEATFRESNELIQRAAAEYGLRHQLPFICECSNPACTEIVRMEAAAYERLRSNPRHFVNAPGHERAAGPHVVVIEQHDGYDVVEKVGEAAQIVTELDPRGARK
jgi:hypothetical protein